MLRKRLKHYRQKAREPIISYEQALGSHGSRLRGGWPSGVTGWGEGKMKGEKSVKCSHFKDQKAQKSKNKINSHC